MLQTPAMKSKGGEEGAEVWFSNDEMLTAILKGRLLNDTHRRAAKELGPTRLFATLFLYRRQLGFF